MGRPIKPKTIVVAACRFTVTTDETVIFEAGDPVPEELLDVIDNPAVLTEVEEPTAPTEAAPADAAPTVEV